MEKAESFEDLLVWQKAHRWVLGVYRLSKPFPKDELYGLTAQLRRAAVSVPSNIAEGFKRRSLSDKARIFNIAQASLAEASYHLILARDLEYADSTLLLNEADQIGKLLQSYRAAVLAHS